MDGGPSNCNGKASYKEDVSVDKEEDEESSPLLSPPRGGIAKNPNKSNHKVQWNDSTGNKLVQVLEFQPSDESDTDDDDLDSCICTIL